jgi:PAS domain S-box-containing protein
MTALGSSAIETSPGVPADARPRPFSFIGAAIVGAVTLGVTLAAWHSVVSGETQRAEAHFDASARRVAAAISERMAAYEQVLRGGVGLFNANQAVTGDDWDAYARALDVSESYPGILGIAFAAHVAAAEREPFVARMRAQGRSDYRIWPEGNRAEYVPVTYLTRFGPPNPRVFGFDLLSEPIRREAIRRAQDTGAGALSAKLTLVNNDTASRVGVLLFLPVYRRDQPLDTPADRRAATVGFVCAPFRIDDLMRGTLGGYEHDLALEVHDGTAISAASLLYRSSPEDAGAAFGWTRQIQVYGRTWTLRVAALPGFETVIGHWKSRGILVFGAALSLLLMALTWVMQNTRNSALRLARDMTAALRASEAEHRDSRALLRAVIDAVPAAIRVKDRDLRYVLVNDSFAGRYGLPAEAFPGRIAADFHTPAIAKALQAEQAKVFATGEAEAPRDVDEAGADGRMQTWLTTAAPLRDGSGAVKYVLGVSLDITERKQAERALAASERKYRELVETQTELVTRFRPDTTLTFVNPAFCRYHGASPEDLLGRRWLPHVHQDDRAAVQQLLGSLTPDNASGTIEHRIVMAGGEIRWMQWSDTAAFDAEGRAIEYQSVGRDITEKKLAEQKLRESERQMRHLVESAGVVPYTWDVAARNYSYIGPQIEQLLGHSSAQWTDKGVWMDTVHPDDRGRVEAWTRDFDARPRDSSLEYRLLRPDGGVVWVRDIIKIETDESGRAVGYGTVVDMTDSKLRDGQLLQARKMEAVGQLTSGIAHDFNNLLMVVIGNLDLLLPRLDAGDPLARELAEAALKAGVNGGELTKQLLAFARKQPLQTVAVDVNALAARSAGLLRRTLGETIDIETALAPGLWPIESDPAQLEAALTNLAINARDAMPAGGRLTISTENAHLDRLRMAMDGDIEPGDYVILTVADTGSGIPPEVIDRIFEPFFTTKATGRGSGLGLSMIYGFARQSNGHIDIESAVGDGTSVRLYLPRAARAAEPVRAAAGGADAAAAAGEMILVVEDDATVRGSVALLLQQLGYRTLEAADGQQALAILERDTRIDLLFSDVVMPGGFSGRQLAAATRRKRPEVRILLTSGFPDKAGDARAGERTEHMLSKPYRRQDLAAKLREIFAA